MSIPSSLRGIAALLLVTLAWGSTFPAMKELTGVMSPAVIVFSRFVVAALLLMPFLRRASRSDLASGAMLGVLLFFCYVFQVEGLALTSSNRNAFITGMNVLVVPLLGVLAGRWPERRMVVALLLAVSGLTAMCWDGGAWGLGDSLSLAGAFCFGLYIKAMESRSRQAKQLMAVTAMQIATVAFGAALWMGLTEVPTAPASFAAWLAQLASAIKAYLPQVLYLGVVATAAIIALQGWGQARVSANEAAVIYAFEPASAAFFAYFWLHETMSTRAWIGAVLLIAGIITSQWRALAVSDPVLARR